jgi:HKD family nuclease
MAEKEFILQGFTARTHADAVREIFAVANIEKVIVSVAFVSESGVKQIEGSLTPHASKAKIFAGVRNDITSYQGLVALHGLASDLYIVDTGSRSVLFHPKLYFVKGDARARMVIGSANLTLGGLNNNIEAGMLLDFDLTNAADKAAVVKIEAEFDKLAVDFDTNVLKINAVPDLDALLANGRIVDEMAAAPPRPSGLAGSGDGTGDTIPRIKLKVVPLRRALKKAKAAAKPKTAAKPAKAAAGGVPTPKPVPKAAGVQFELVWESKPLTLRDLNIPDGGNTNKTGSMNLDKGLLPADVDHRHYFREEIFNQLSWSVTNAKTTEVAHAKFHLVIKGISYGDFDLRLGHTMGTTSKAYKQNNAMTRLSWGPVKDYVGHDNLKDRTLSLFRDAVDPTRFVLEID